jgi:hypothetical protein
MHGRFTHYLCSSILICSWALCASVQADQESVLSEPAEKKGRFHTAKSHSGRFLVFGTSSIQNLDLAKWAERIAETFEEVVGIKPSYESGYSVRIFIEKDKADASDSRERDWVTSQQTIVDGRMIARLLIHSYSKVDTERAREELCRLFLDCAAGDRLSRMRGRRGTLTKKDVESFAVPVWVSRGVAQNLFAENRAVNSEEVVQRWSKGSMKSLDELLAGDDPDAAVAGIFVGLLLTAPDPSYIFHLMLKQRARGRDVTPSWAAGQHPEGARFSRTSEMWEEWLTKQKRIVYKPGYTPSFMYEELAKALVFHPSEAELTSAGEKVLLKKMLFRDVIGMRKEKWVRELCSKKAGELAILAAGRGDEFIGIVTLYTEFLNGVTAGRKVKQLEDALEEADFTWAEALEKKVHAEPGSRKSL